MAWYRTGTITVTNGSTTVTGSGTAWIANAGVGEALYAPDGRLYEIASISSDTTMTLASAYLGSNQSGQAYVIVPSQSYIRDLAAQAADLVNNYSTIYNTVGQGKFPDGTLAAPSIRFSDDLDTGFYRSASNEVTFVAGGVAQFKYNSSGLTLLNGSQSFTTIDATTLEVTNIKAKDGTAAGSIADATGVVTFGSTILTTTDINGGTIDGTAIGGATPAAGAFTTLTTSSNVTLSGGTANGVAYLNASKVLTTGSALTFDGTKLNVNTGVAGVIADFTDGVAQTLRIGTTASYAYIDNPSASALGFRLIDAEQMRLTSTGLGIGTSSIEGKVSIQVGVSDNSIALRKTSESQTNPSLILSPADNSSIRLTAGTTSGYSSSVDIAGNNTGYIRFLTQTAERMRIDSSGNVKLAWGGTSLGWYFDTAYNMGMSSDSTTRSLFIDNLSSDSGGAIIFRNTVTGTLSEKMRIDASGNVGIGTSSPGARLHAYRNDNNYTGFFANASPTGNGVIIRSGSNNNQFPLDVQTYDGGSYLLRVRADGNTFQYGSNFSVMDGNLVIGTSGKGIDFSADGQAAGMTSELLDDYEEGTFTPTAIGTDSAGTGTYTFQTGRYTKVGNTCFFTLSLGWSDHTGVGNLRLAGLPFISADVSNLSSQCPIAVYDLTITGVAKSSILTNSTNIFLISEASGASTAIAMDTAVTAIYVSGSYFCA